jgi:mannose-6-phosphate isomerase-like protein (cupin superfamily)
MLKNVNRILGLMVASSTLALVAFGQQAGADTRKPAEAVKPFIVMNQQSLSDLEKKLSVDNKVEDLTGGQGTQLRVAIQHDKVKANSDAESHDNSDDVYYVLEGEAELTLGGRLETPREISPGEWRSKMIAGGQTMIIKKGDLIIVPRGTPHQRNNTKTNNFSLILIKVYKDPLPPPPVK